MLDAQIGNPKYYKLCGAYFICDTPLASDAGARDPDQGQQHGGGKKALVEAGCDGTPVVILAATESDPAEGAAGRGRAARRAEAGFKVDLQAMDWQTVVTRRANQKSPKEGGWNMFFTYTRATDSMNPLVNVPMGGKGKEGGWFGWPEDPKIEELRDAFARATSTGRAEEDRLRRAEGGLPIR